MSLPHDITIASAPADGPEAVACLAAYYAELDERFPEGFDVSVGPGTDLEELSPPRGDLLVVRRAGVTVGVGAVRLLDEPGHAEVKRKWLDPRVRGRGIASALLSRLEQRAGELGATTLTLDTRRLLGAVPFYLGKGYASCPAFNENPYADWWGTKAL